jgi:adenylate cyclase
MAEVRTNRRLAAILAADVVGYSRLMASDEAGTLAALKRHREGVFDPAVAANKGRIVKLIGDGTLVEFGSVVDAVNCAIAIQRAVAAEPAADPGIVLRIGVNLGDIVVEGDDIYGDGVNVAARLEPLAAPGGVCVAAIVHDSIGGRIDVGFTDGGEVQVKNIDRPIRVWKWHPTSSAGSPSPTASPPAERGVLPSLAVLPFQNMSGDAQEDYFADGVVEDIITALSRFKSFAVIARNSSFVYKGRAVDVRQVAKELGVSYVLEGSVRRSGERLRITAQLVEASGGAHLWADRFDGAVADVFDVQDRITESVIGVIEPHVQQAEIERSRRKRPEILDAYDLYLRALSKSYSARPEDNAETFAQMMQAVALEPHYAPFLAGACWALEFRVAMGWPTLTGDDRAASLDLVRRALADPQGDATVLAQCGLTLVSLRDYDRGMQIVANAVEANPNSQFVLMVAGIANLHCGSIDDALAYLHRAIRLSPRDPNAYNAYAGIAHVQMILGDYPEAIRRAEKSLALNAHFDATYWMLIAANAQLGRMDEARRWLGKFQALVPGVTIARIRDGQPAKDPSRLAAILDGLRLAGLPED